MSSPSRATRQLKYSLLTTANGTNGITIESSKHASSYQLEN